MAYPAYIRDKARSLRSERQMTIDEIAARLALPRTTVFYFVRDLPLARAAFDPRPAAAARRRGNLAMQAKCRRLREEAYADGAAMFPELCREPSFRDFVCLYIAEGHKRDRNQVAIANSDPAVITVGDRWIRRFSRNPIQYWIQYHADQRLEDLTAFWSSLLGVPPEAIRLQRKSNSSQLARRTWRCEHGVMTVRASDTLFRARLQAWMDLLRAEWI
ncbi:hypothetical protein BH20ACT19_BH20ACT19_01010 [soil metagenome]